MVGAGYTYDNETQATATILTAQYYVCLLRSRIRVNGAYSQEDVHRIAALHPNPIGKQPATLYEGHQWTGSVPGPWW